MSGGDLAALAQRIVDDGHAPIRDRVLAVNILHRLQNGLPVAGQDMWRVRLAHGVRRREVIAAASTWCGVSG